MSEEKGREKKSGAHSKGHQMHCGGRGERRMWEAKDSSGLIRNFDEQIERPGDVGVGQI